MSFESLLLALALTGASADQEERVSIDVAGDAGIAIAGVLSPLEYAQLPELIDRELWQDITRWLVGGGVG